MEFYRVIVETFNDGHCVGTSCGTSLLEEEPKDFSEKITWDNLAEKYTQYGINLYFNVWNFKKGRVVSFFNNKFFPKPYEKDVKEWKNPLDIVVKVTYKKYTTMSIEEVLKWHDIEKAIQYLKERGLAICPYESK